jgi:hypothetical protein
MIPNLSILLMLTIFGIALADYIGPNRTTTRRVRDPINDYWICKKAGYVDCKLHHDDNPCPDAGGSHPSVQQQNYWCGWTADSCECKPAYKTETTELPPATVSGSFSCVNMGSEGWCVGGGALELSASEPLSGYVITTIEGDPGMLCDPEDAASVSCTWGGGGEGNATINFWAHSSYGDTSGMSSAVWKQDTAGPICRFGNPSEGSTIVTDNVVNMSGSCSDGVSGLHSAQISLNGGKNWEGLSLSGESWSTSWDSRKAGNGTYTFLVRARDRAGNTGGNAKITVKVDIKPPSVAIPDTWFQWEEAAIQVKKGSLSLKNVKLTIYGGGFGDRIYEWNPGEVPAQFNWDGYFGDTQAPPGEYEVELKAWDSNGNSGSDTGWVVVPEPPTETPTSTPTETTTPTPTATPTVTPTSTQISTATIAPTATPEPTLLIPDTAGPVEAPPESGISWVVALPVVGLALILGGVAIMDPRPPSWERLGDIRRSVMEAEESRKRR